ncbi:MAG: 50S ribosomal protein L25 [Alphaproteobacteria bacterium]|nr:50S ribosomal protein L25 [Alphaproteobacteria bacterium]
MEATPTITLKKRTVLGKGVHALRSQGIIPVVCYGLKKEAQNFQVDSRELARVIKKSSVLIQTEGDISSKVLMHAVDYDPVQGTIRHVDFLFVDTTHAVEHHVPLMPVGEAPGVKLGGILTIIHSEILIKALPQHIPSHIDVSVESLTELNSHILAGDITLPTGVELVEPEKSEVVISIVPHVEESIEETPVAFDPEKIESSSTKGKKEEPVIDDEASK